MASASMHKLIDVYIYIYIDHAFSSRGRPVRGWCRLCLLTITCRAVFTALAGQSATPLMAAARAGAASVVKLLLLRGAGGGVNDVEHSKGGGQWQWLTPLHYAIDGWFQVG